MEKKERKEFERILGRMKVNKRIIKKIDDIKEGKYIVSEMRNVEIDDILGS